MKAKVLFLLLVAHTSFASASFLGAMTQTLEAVRDQKPKSIDQFIAKAKALKAAGTAKEQAQTISQLMFSDLALVPDTSFQSRDRMDNILPDAVLQTKHGHCLGLTVLFVLAAEAKGYDVSIVHVPDHIFPRLCDSAGCINVEMLKKGELMPDEYYVKNTFIPKEAIEKGLYLKGSKEPQDLVASVFIGMGFVAASVKQDDLAELFYKRAVEAYPKSTEAHSNFAAALLKRGEKEEAVQELKTAESLNPYSYFVLANLGVLAQNASDLPTALKYYDRALAANPLAAAIYYRRGTALLKLKKTADAAIDFKKVLVIQPAYCSVARELVELLDAEKLGGESEIKKYRTLAQQKSCLPAPN